MTTVLIRGFLALLFVIGIWFFGTPAYATVFSREYEIDLADLAYTLQSDGITTAALASVGDQLITTVTFVDNQRLQLRSGTIEAVQIQYLGPPGNVVVIGAPSETQGSRSLQVLTLLGVTGNYDGLDEYVLDQTFFCGNCLIAFTLGDNLT